MTVVFIENVWGSGQNITVAEAFKDHIVSHRLKPGDNVRIAASRFKSISIDEEVAAARGLTAATDGPGARTTRAA